MDVYRSIVVTGAGGMLAHALLDLLRARRLNPIPLKHSDCDITDPDAVARVFQDHRPTLLLNCAAHTGVDQCEDEPKKADAINGEGPGHLANFARERQTKLIHFSTDFVFDGHIDRPYRPEDRPNPPSAYGSSKLLGEQLIQQADPSGWIIVRAAWLFGRYGDCFPQTIVKLARSKRQIQVVADQIGSPTATVDLAGATLALVDQDACGVFHVTNSGTTSWYGFAAATLEEFGVKADLAQITTAEWLKMHPKQAKRPAYSVLDTSKYTTITGQVPRGWREALREYRLGERAL